MKLHHMYSPGFGFLIWYGREYTSRPICWEIQIWKWKISYRPWSD